MQLFQSFWQYDEFIGRKAPLLLGASVIKYRPPVLLCGRFCNACASLRRDFPKPKWERVPKQHRLWTLLFVQVVKVPLLLLITHPWGI
jgi:hypothetical protein